jgi:hypothetical protein
MESWSLTDASRAFEDAIARDAQFASAHLWLALARNWNGAEPTRFRLPAEQAQRFIQHLPARERQMTRAVLAEARVELGTACAEWRGRTNADSLDFVAWYGEAHCERKDDVVVPDVRSPSGWRYRSSLAHALYDFQRAFRLQPLILFAFRGSSFRPLRTLFFAGETYYRSGRSEGENPRVFTARIAVAGDSLVTVPFPGTSDRYPSERALDAFAEAVHRQRLLVRDVASSWVSAFPDNADARYAFALSLAALGDPQAPDTLAVARRNVRSPEQAVLLALAEVWMSVGLGVSRREGEFLSRARSLADSLLAVTDPARTTQPLQMAAVAALTGRATLAAQYARRPEVAPAYRADPPLAGIAVPLLVYALFAAPADSLAAFEQRVSMAIARHPGEDPRTTRLRWLARAATLCYPLCRMRSRDSLLRTGDELLDAQADRDGERFDAVRAFFARTAAARAHRLVELVSLDALTPEAELLASLGDEREAARWIEPTLLHASEIPPELLGFPERTVALVRGMMLLGRIAERAGVVDEAKRWRELVNILWSNADPGVWSEPVFAGAAAPAVR